MPDEHLPAEQPEPRRRGRRGRPHILDQFAPLKSGQQRQKTHRELFLDAIRGCNTIEGAAAWAGVSKKLIYNCIRRGRKQKRGYYSDFVHALEVAMGEAEVIQVGMMTRAGQDGNVLAIKFMLERRFPKRWGPKEHTTATITHKGDPDEPAVFTMHIESPATLKDDPTGVPEQNGKHKHGNGD